MSENYKYFAHRECEYFPCHAGADADDFNCLFCYCPLYALGDRCGGCFRYTESGIKDCTGCGGDFEYLPGGVKDCSRCTYPHRRESYDGIIARLGEIAGE